MKKIISMLLVLVMVLSMAACGAKTEAPAASEAPVTESTEPALQTVNPGKLTMATSPDFAPYEFYALDADGNASLAGFDIALGHFIADYLGLELEIIPMDFDGTLMELASKNVDIALAGYSPDPSRMDKMDFSDVYYLGGQSFVCLKANADKFASLDDVNDPSLQVGAQLGSIQVNLAKEFSADTDIVELAKVTDIISELLAGHLDGAYIETAVAETYAMNYPDLAVVLAVPYDAEGSAVGVYKGNDALLAGVNAAIAEALSSGKMGQFVAEANELAGGNIYEGLLEN